VTEVMHNGRPIIAARQTTLGLYVTAKEAYDMWQADPEGVNILDVRTPEEWVFIGHAPMATLIPLAFMAYVWDEAKQGFSWQMNEDFIKNVTIRFPADAMLLVSCRSGGRSAMAVNALAKAGYTKAYNILDGMEGETVRDPDSVFDGMHHKNGWEVSGLPWTYALDPVRMALPAFEGTNLYAGNEAD
jgi:rhodanese-related sulfurtransferase